MTDTSASSLLSYLPEDAWTVLIEPLDIKDRADSLLRESRDITFDYDTVYDELKNLPMASLSALPVLSPDISFRSNIFDNLGDDTRQKLEKIAQIASSSDLLILFCSTPSEERRFKKLFGWSSHELRDKFQFRHGDIAKGFRCDDIGISFIGYNELFGRTRLKRETRRIASRPIEHYLELKEGDLVVHLGNGIGRYHGLTTMKKGNVEKEYLVLEYSNNALLYVSPEQVDLIQKYIGAADIRPTLDTLGSKRWQNTKDKVTASTAELASELLRLKAIRASRQGFRYSAEDEIFLEFESAFPYEETPDQNTVMDDIKKDLSSEITMDRLVCGDVGFGKTELAMRAAFMVVSGGQQVAVLVPTTVLASQHYHTFSERMADYPVTVDMLSRFKTKKATKGNN